MSNQQQESDEWYDQVYFDSDLDSDEDMEDADAGIGLPGKPKNKGNNEAKSYA